MKLSSAWVLFCAAVLAIEAQAAAPSNAVIPDGYTMTAVATGLTARVMSSILRHPAREFTDYLPLYLGRMTPTC